MLLAELLLRVAQVRLGLVADRGASRSNLTLHGGHGLSGDLADRSRNTWDVRPGAPTERLDPRGDLALVVTGLLEVLLQALLVRLLLCQRDVRGEIRLQLRLLGVSLTQPLHQL